MQYFFYVQFPRLLSFTSRALTGALSNWKGVLGLIFGSKILNSFSDATDDENTNKVFFYGLLFYLILKAEGNLWGKRRYRKYY